MLVADEACQWLISLEYGRVFLIKVLGLSPLEVDTLFSGDLDIIDPRIVVGKLNLLDVATLLNLVDLALDI